MGIITATVAMVAKFLIFYVGLKAATAAFIAKAIVTVAVSYAINTVSSAFRKKPRVNLDSLNSEQTVARRMSLNAPLEVLVGRRMVGGVALNDDSFGTKREYAIQVTALSSKPCSAFHRISMDGEFVTLSGDPTVGEVNVTSHFLGKGNAPRATVRIFLGDDNSGLSTYLRSKMPDKYADTDNHGDYCVAVVICRSTNDDFDTGTGESFIPFSSFPDIKYEMSGVKVCDPRIEGSDYADETTYVYSDNPALIEAQYDYGWFSGEGANRALIVGFGYPEEIMNIDQIISNADYCDTEGFICAGVIRSGPTSDIGEVRKCYNAVRVESPSSVYSVAEGNRVDAGTIDLSPYISAYVSQFDRDGLSTEVYNQVSATYIEPTEAYGEKEMPIYTRPEWVAADNHIPRQMMFELPMVPSLVPAAKLVKQEVFTSRASASMTIMDLPYSFIRYNVGDTLTITGSDISYVNGKRWVIDAVGSNTRGDVTMLFREAPDPEAFAFDPATETPDVPTNTPAVNDWVDVFNPVTYPYLPPNSFVSFGTYVNDSIRADSLNEVRDLTTGGIVTADLLLANITPSSVGVTGTAASLTTPLATCVASRGVGPYTYSWSRYSGDVLTVNSPTSDSTTFTGSPAVGELLIAIYKCEVTDSDVPANTFSAYVSVDIERTP